jgi:nucleoside 2-deoxyribosyltransferase
MSHALPQFYVAGPLFSDAQRSYLEQLVGRLARALDLDPRKDFFLPHRDAGDVGEGHTQRNVFEADLRHVRGAAAVIAWLDGQDADSGTAVEMGIAYEAGKPVFGLLTDFRCWQAGALPTRLNNMIWGMCDDGRAIARSIEDLEKLLLNHTKARPAK